MNKSFDNQLKDNILETFFDNSPAPVWIVDEDRKVLFINDCARKVWNLDSNYRNKHTSDLFPRTFADRFLASDREVLLSGQPVSSVTESLCIDGSCGNLFTE